MSLNFSLKQFESLSSGMFLDPMDPDEYSDNDDTASKGHANVTMNIVIVVIHIKIFNHGRKSVSVSRPSTGLYYHGHGAQSHLRKEAGSRNIPRSSGLSRRGCSSVSGSSISAPGHGKLDELS